VRKLGLQQLELGLGVEGEMIDRHDAGESVVLMHIVHVPLQVDDAPLERRQILLVDLLEIAAAVVLERANGRDENHRRRFSVPPCGT